jgi:RNA polymerase sigma-70 factor (ECF subfamily)
MQRELVDRAIKGDYDAFTALVHASASRQYAIATLILRDGDRAQDAVQEALVAAWRGLSALRDPDAWEPWLHRLTVRACFVAARRQKRRTVAEVPMSSDREPTGSGDEPALFAERERLEQELGRLPLDQRAVLVLHFYVGLPLTETAVVLDIPPGTAKSRLHRGLEALRSSLTAEAELSDGRGRERFA